MPGKEIGLAEFMTLAGNSLETPATFSLRILTAPCLRTRLMPGGGMRVGENLKLTPENVIVQKLLLHTPKSGNEVEAVSDD
jgi:hypothetical protein